jgi:hypothetical protein
VSTSLIETVAVSAMLFNSAARSAIRPEWIQDEELRLLAWMVKDGSKRGCRHWMTQNLGVDCTAGVIEGLAKRLREDAEHDGTVNAMMEMLSEAVDRRESRAAQIEAAERKRRIQEQGPTEH